MTNLTGDILVVDDIAANLQIMREMLTKEGHTVRAAINGETALIALQQPTPELILLDVMMPIMDGYEVCRRVKENPNLAHLPVIFITALNDTSDKLIGFELGAVDYITKPFQIAEVRARINTHLSVYKQQQENIRLNRLYDDLFNNVNDLIQSVDHLGNYQYVNRCWSKTLGYSLQEAQQMNFLQIVHPDYIPHCVDVFEKLGHGEAMQATIFAVFLSKTGDEILVEGNVTASHTEHGVVHTRGIFRNVTEKKRLEEQTLRLIIEREKMRVLTDFISTTSHDLRTPLTRISLSAHMLERTQDAEKVREKTRTILEQVSHLDEILTQMFHLTMLDSRISLSKKTYNLNTLLTLPEKYQNLANTKNISIHYDLANNMPPVVFDATFIQEAFHALIHNALIYTHDGGQIIIRTRIENEHMILCVADNGIGIPPENQSFIFERFYKVNSARTADGSGAGLGLALVKKIAEAHDGQIIVQSTLNKGSTFLLLLPI